MPARSPDFRFIPASSVGMRFTDNDATVTFGMEDESSPEKIYEQVAVVMSHRTLKLLANMLIETIDHYERTTKASIFLDQAKIDDLKELLDRNTPKA